MASLQASRADRRRMQHELNQGNVGWSHEHAERYGPIGTLPSFRFLFRDQNINRTHRRLSRIAIWLPETARLKAYKTLYYKTLGSAALADAIINGFQTTSISDEDDAPSIAEYTAEALDANESLAIASGHADSLSDVGEFTLGLNYAIALEHGTKYMNRFNIVINPTMAWETYDAGKPVPMTWILSLGIGQYFAPPRDGALAHRISQQTIDYMSGRTSMRIMKDKKQQAMVLGLVPAGSGALKVMDESGNEKIIIKDASQVAPLMARFNVVPVNRLGSAVRIGQLLCTKDFKHHKKAVRDAAFTDQVNQKHAEQIHELTGLPVQFSMLNIDPGVGAETIVGE